MKPSQYGNNAMDPAWGDDPLWYKDAVIYQLHVKAFYDSNDDGYGDFQGLTQKLDYIQSLGVNTLWLLPFYPSPMRDDGYDISDYHNIYPAYGTRRDFRHFVREAHERGLKIITELVINHTSDQHPWFKAAREAPRDSSKRNFYVWSDTDQKFPETRIIFTDTESSNWAWDPVAQQYYWHRFFSHQPDLNHNNPNVVNAIIRVMRFWLDMGVDGLRLDAIPYLTVREGTNNENLPETHAVIKQMRAVVDAHYKGRLFLAEANQWPEDVREYFGDGDECHMAYHFPLMPRMYMAVAQEDRHPITEIMAQTPEIPDNCQWAIFLRNHDELTLEMVTDRERDYMYKRYAADPRMRINVGIRRRLAPLLDNDLDVIKLMNSLLLSMPGSPILYYGDEIGMGDNIYLGDRNGVRTPMQWSPDRNAGFSRADPQRLYLPPIMDPVYGYQAVNVEAQSRDSSSLLNWMRRMLIVRREHQAFGRGRLTFLRPGNRKILAYLREYNGQTLLCIANLSSSAQPVELDLSRFKGCVPVELLGLATFPPIGELPYLLTLAGRGFYWFRLAGDSAEPGWHQERLPVQELPTLVLFADWQSFFVDQVTPSRGALARQTREHFERVVLPGFLAAQRWFAAKGMSIVRIELQQAATWSTAAGRWLWSFIRVHFGNGETQTYSLPLALAWGDTGDDASRPLLSAALAKVRQQARMGLLYDAVADACFCKELVAAMGERRDIPFGAGKLCCSSTTAYTRLRGEGDIGEVRVPTNAGSNTAVVFGDHFFLKLYRRLQEGINPEVEMGRFLTEVSPFPNIVPLAGAVEYREADRCVAVAILQGYVRNQGDTWGYTIDYLARHFEETLLQSAAPVAEPHVQYLMLMTTLGRRTAELHRALSRSSGDPAFEPEPITEADLTEWKSAVAHDVDTSLDLLAPTLSGLNPYGREAAERVLGLREAIKSRIEAATPHAVTAMKTRYHGDYHLGQVLLAEDDFIIIDFEGEPARTLTSRRLKHSPLRDVAGMLRSFSYAGATGIERVTLAKQPEARKSLMRLARAWEEAASAAFLNAYLATAADSPALPSDKKAMHAMLDLFVLEKALYELRYELNNRPDWVAIPLIGLLRIMGAEDPTQ